MPDFSAVIDFSQQFDGEDVELFGEMLESRRRQTKAQRRRKNGKPPSADKSYKVVRKRLASIKPSPENLRLYNEINTSDLDFVRLAKSIRKHGLQEPLIVTSDGYIVSGHRRYAALCEIGQVVVRCRVLRVSRESMTDDEFVALLREHNRQRNKTVAEQVREELVDVDPDVAHARLREMRDKSIHRTGADFADVVRIEGQKKRYNISDEKADHVKYIKKIVFEDRRDYWPLTVRGVHYPLLNYKFLRNIPQKLRYLNDDLSYDATSELCTRLRIFGELPWEAFTDDTRPITLFRPFSDVRQYIRQETANLFTGYWRDLLQTQPNWVECVVEKNTVYHLALRVTQKYQIPTSSGRGFNSIDPWHELYERHVNSGRKRLIVIVLSDFDPEGEMIPQVGGRTLRDDFGVPASDLEIIRAGVTREEIDFYDLPQQNFAKESSSNHTWFVDRNDGDTSVYELEALDPANMLSDLEDAVTSVLDMDLFNLEAQREKDESGYLISAQEKAMAALKGLGE